MTKSSRKIVEKYYKGLYRMGKINQAEYAKRMQISHLAEKLFDSWKRLGYVSSDEQG